MLGNAGEHMEHFKEFLSMPELYTGQITVMWKGISASLSTVPQWLWLFLSTQQWVQMWIEVWVLDLGLVIINLMTSAFIFHIYKVRSLTTWYLRLQLLYSEHLHGESSDGNLLTSSWFCSVLGHVLIAMWCHWHDVPCSLTCQACLKLCTQEQTFL